MSNIEISISFFEKTSALQIASVCISVWKRVGTLAFEPL